MKAKDGFLELVRKAWGNPHKVADVAFGELFRHDLFDMDLDDQVRLAKEVGVLAGEMKGTSPEEFVSAFES